MPYDKGMETKELQRLIDPSVTLHIPVVNASTLIPCGEGLYLPSAFSVARTGVKGNEVLQHKITFNGESSRHTLKVAGISLLSSEEIDGAMLRELRFDELRRAAMGLAILLGCHVNREEVYLPYHFQQDLELVVSERNGRGTPDLRRIARLYSAASIQWPNPRDYIAEAFDVTTTTVSYWVRKAREAGFYVGYSEEERAKAVKEHEEIVERLAQYDVESPVEEEIPTVKGTLQWLDSMRSRNTKNE